MTQPDAFALSRSNLNGFLFADIGIERSGMPLSVISALARQGLDPWQEAERLAKEPRTVATDGLARLITAMPSSLWSPADAAAIAARLVALLPGQVKTDAAPQSAASSTHRLTAEATKHGPWLVMAILTVILLAGIAAFVTPHAAGPAPAPPATVAPINQVPTGG